LLDWTESPLVAAYVTVERTSEALTEQAPNEDERVGIYVSRISDLVVVPCPQQRHRAYDFPGL
jgi:hypothetical protein